MSTIDAGIIDDYNASRESLRLSIEATKIILRQMTADYTVDPSPNSARAISEMINSMTNVSKGLVDNIKTISDIYMKIKNTDPENENVKTVFNNAVIVGTLEDAMRLTDDTDKKST